MTESVGTWIVPIARIHTDFPTKFGLPRQSGLVQGLEGIIVFEPAYREPEALRGLEGFSHLWLIWQFSQSICEEWSPTVRPPRLGGNKRVGVFASRSPFRPNSIGLSCVKLESAELRHPDLGPVIYVSGIDMMDGTPIFDIKPYVPHGDSRPEAKGGFSAQVKDYELEVEFPEQWLRMIPKEKRISLIQVLAQDPRPAYQKEPERIYGFAFAGMEIKFTVEGTLLRVRKVEKR
ncbi:MAG: tRNA (N6-threonylcarbamoyladenosine(37)-N6)-methyltransferase TrmO [Firmicutes bacterium]|nr:tRNA (N6-threonylcarbamoyladenosine(37)-N6)-methyltransferase TrmO [Bacillota bacterium]NBI64190.1 tRNA (N6-threonylcarbamoyladenosine(37)-N6)-methyltransferase TrmO [Clostridiales bacterium]